MAQNGRGRTDIKGCEREIETTGRRVQATYAMAERMQIGDRCQMQKMVCKKEML